MAIEEETYRSFLLRMWQVAQNGVPTWRCSPEEAGRGERHNFASLAELMAYLSAISLQSDCPPAGLDAPEGEDQNR